MKGPVHLLPRLAHLIDSIASISGVSGLSVGVFCQGDVVFRHNYGHGDLSIGKPTTSDTIYPIASLSKSFTSFLYGSLVSKGLAEWSSPIRETLPDFHSTSAEVTAWATPVDLLSHRTGIPGGESLYWHAQPLLNDSDILPMFASLPALHQFRTEWVYSNLGYAVVSLAMSSLTGKSYTELFESTITGPFGLHRTGLGFDNCQDCDVAKTYLATENGSAIENTAPFFAPGSAMAAAGGISSSVNDLLVFYRAMLQQLAGAPDPTPPQHSLNDVAIITSAKTFMKNAENSLLERSYGLGWIRTQLPGTLGAMGLNPWLTQMPLVNTSRLALYHQGNLAGATSSVYLFPETRSGVVVLSNGYGLCDAPDWIAQLITDALFETGSKTDHVKLAEEAAGASKDLRLRTVRDIDGMKSHDAVPSTPHKSLEGIYYNAAASFFIDIFSNKDDLKIAFQGQRGDAFTLQYLHEDTYTWFTSTRQMAQQGRHIYPTPYYLIRFNKNRASKVVSLEWAHNGSETGGEVFTKAGKPLSATPWNIAVSVDSVVGLISLVCAAAVMCTHLLTRRPQITGQLAR